MTTFDKKNIARKTTVTEINKFVEGKIHGVYESLDKSKLSALTTDKNAFESESQRVLALNK